MAAPHAGIRTAARMEICPCPKARVLFKAPEGQRPEAQAEGQGGGGPAFRSASLGARVLPAVPPAFRSASVEAWVASSETPQL